jgi:hypothetical protein
VGGALGLAVIATLASTHTGNLLASGESRAEALTGGYHLAFFIGAGLAAAAIGLALALLEPAKAEPEPEIERRRMPEPAYADGC